MAAKTITQRIALSGGQEIEVQLKNMGDAGQTAFQRINASAATTAAALPAVSASFEELKLKIEAVGTAAATFGTKLDAVGTSARSFATSILAISFVAVGVGVGLGELVLKAAEAADAIQRGAEQAQLSTDTFQDLQAAFAISGVGVDALDTAVSRLNRSFGVGQTDNLKLAKAQKDLTDEFTSGKINATQYNDQLQKLQKNARENVDVFNRLGVSFNSVGGNTEEALKQVALSILNMPKGIERASLELQVFGRSGTALDPVLKNLAGIGDATTGLVQKLSPLEIAVGANLSQAFRTLQQNVDRTYNHFFLAFGPNVATLVKAFSTALVSNEGAFASLALTVENKVAPVLKDLIALVQNGRSAVTSGGLVDILLTGFLNVIAAGKILVAGLVGGFQLISAALAPVAELINKVFGTQTTGAVLLIVAAVLQLTGGFRLLFSVIEAGVAGVKLLSAIFAVAFAPGGVLLIGIGLVVAAVSLLALTHLPELKAAFNAVYDFMAAGVKGLVDIWDKLNATVQGAIDSVKKFLGLQSAGGQSGDAGTAGYAGGGQVRGAGSGTSDSILARLSNGEFVQRAQAVAFYGPAFMAALNQMRIPRNVVEGLAGFANGGLVRAIGSASSAMIPRFAAGGLVTSGLSGGGQGHPVTLNINGEHFTGLTAEDSTFAKLQRFAVRKNVQSPGRKPLWVT